jgi:hypothetical protein
MIQRVCAGAGEKEGEGEKELRQRVFHPVLGNVETVGKMHQQDGACHDDQKADRAYAKEHAGENRKPAGDLGQADEITNDYGSMHETCKSDWAGASECAQENGGTMIEKHHGTGQAQKQKREIVPRRILREYGS